MICSEVRQTYIDFLKYRSKIFGFNNEKFMCSVCCSNYKSVVNKIVDSEFELYNGCCLRCFLYKYGLFEEI